MTEKPNNPWNFFEYIVVNTVNNSKEFKENMKAVGIKNYQIRSGESVAKFNSGDVNECNTLGKFLGMGLTNLRDEGSYDPCCGAICHDLTNRSIELIRDAYRNFKKVLLTLPVYFIFL